MVLVVSLTCMAKKLHLVGAGNTLVPNEFLPPDFAVPRVGLSKSGTHQDNFAATPKMGLPQYTEIRRFLIMSMLIDGE